MLREAFRPASSRVWQHAVLCRTLRGHYGYYGITGNSVAITRFRDVVRTIWRKWLNRRGGTPSPTCGDAVIARGARRAAP